VVDFEFHSEILLSMAYPKVSGEVLWIIAHWGKLVLALGYFFASDGKVAALAVLVVFFVF